MQENVTKVLKMLIVNMKPTKENKPRKNEIQAIRSSGESAASWTPQDIEGVILGNRVAFATLAGVGKERCAG